MKILFLGTGAADWDVLPESETPVGHRRRSSMIIDGCILLDAAPQFFDYAKKLGTNLGGITDCFITHTHCDHYCKDALLNLAKEIGRTINLYCHKGAVAKLGLTDEDSPYINVCPIDVFEEVNAGGYTITPVAANHLVSSSDEQPLHYIMSKNGKTYMCGGDGGLFTAATWEHMRTLCFDGILFDATVGDKEGDFRLGTHNSIPMLRLVVAALAEGNMKHEQTVLVATHLARTLHSGREETEKLFGEIGITVAYDGDTIEM